MLVLKIAYLVNTYPSPSHTFIRREVQALERRGVTVHRFAMRGDRSKLVDRGDLIEHDKTEHVLAKGGAVLAKATLRACFRNPGAMLSALAQVWRAGRRVEGSAVLRHLIYLAEAAYIAERCYEVGISHVHAHFGTNSAMVAMLARQLGGVPYSFTTHGPEEFDHPTALSLGEKLHNAAFAVAISQFGRSQLCRWAAAPDWWRLKVVHCGIEPHLFSKPQPLPSGPLRLVNIGRLSEQKGQLLLVEAMATAVLSVPDLHLTLVGDGALRPQIEAAITSFGLKSHITLTGWLDEAGVRAQLASSHALVLPSFAEGLPMVVMEAMASARLVIATYVAGIPELVKPGYTGWLVPAGDIAALSDAIITVANCPAPMRQTMADAGRERVLERHDIDHEAKKLHALLRGED
jgi:colanic acid/amylovoran biosynthesis glycosyltransferase